ncbi:MAG: tRNA epoxyqueuosine(34) reductase QueG [candidate division WOR-3 bacterium]|nr:tRNA epoxyqueuosine(34) reductase QueG [candidate division WOR-3 bacterium]
MNITQRIKDFAKSLGLEIRVTSAEPFIKEAEKIKKQRERGLFLDNNHWQDRDIENFCNPASVLNGAKSIISAFLFYLTPDEPNLSIPGRPYGLVARYTRRNYYKELKKRLKKLAERLKKEYRANMAVHACGPIAEKPIAQRSGIGYYGKHSIIINPEFGSWIVLGEIITDLELEPDTSLNLNCGDCRRCIDVCPTGAIIEPYVIDRKKCIQNLTHHPCIIPDDIARVWADRIYGCTTCQDVCPMNEKIKPEEPKTEIGTVGAYLPLVEILTMDEKTYRSRYANNQISARWVSFDAIKRNALIALGNIKDKKTIPIIKKFLNNSNYILQETARWALSQF